MKKTITMIAALAAFGLLATTSIRAEDKTVTVTGEGKCAKCAMHETATCQNAIQVKEGSKTVTYYLAKNDMSKEFHENLCHGPKNVTATGTVKEVDGKKELTVTKIELAK